MSSSVIIFSILINIPIIFFFNLLEKKINLFDMPDKVRKFQKKPVALFGGLILIYNFIIINIINLDNNLFLYSEIYFSDSRQFFSFFFGILSCFFIGLYDDKYNISANLKLFFNSLIIFIILIIDDSLVIKELSFSFLENSIELKNFSIFFTLLCILLFINAINMFDGINLQSSFYCLIIFLIFSYKNIFLNLNLLFIIFLLFFMYLNYNNKSFLGDSGTQILAFVIAYFFIKSYNIEKSFTCDQIFIIMMLPGVDMFRLFLYRIIRGRNPFSPDNEHIHHLIINKIGYLGTFLIIQTSIVTLILFSFFLNNNVFIISIFILVYVSLVLILSRK